ncbi:hypothetical protein ABXT06_01530 [Flavobacterium sp. UW10123]|uniref:hypothetical protein n=1 Tax=Flavobacterium sp. UW10123 TaxID=3230800 RepID=UPI0033973CEE
MIISFENKELRSICENEFEAQTKLGLNVSMKLKNRLSDLLAANSVNDLVAGSPSKINENLYRINLVENHFILFSSNHPSPPLTELGEINWNEVSRIKILNISNE